MRKYNTPFLIKELKRYAKAKNPIDANLLGKIPYFTDIFPDKKLWPVLVRLSKKDVITFENEIAYIEYKKYLEGDKLIIEGQSDQVICWILSGYANIVNTIKNKPKIIYKAEKGECVGEQTVLRGALRTADVVAGEKGVSVLRIDWSIIERSSELAKAFYHLFALNLTDKLNKVYKNQLKIITTSIKALLNEITDPIEKYRRLENLLKKDSIDFDSKTQINQNNYLAHVTANIKKSLALLEMYNDRDRQDILGIILGVSNRQ